MKRFELTFTGTAIIDLEDEVINQVDEEFRNEIYNLTSPTQIAEHIGYNLIINQALLSQLDGWANLPDNKAKIVEYCDWGIDVKEIEQ